MKQLVEVIKLVADKYLEDVNLIIGKNNTLILEYYSHREDKKEIYKTFYIQEENSKLKITFLPDLFVKETDLAGFEDILLILKKQSIINEHTQEKIKEIKAKFTKGLKVKLIKMYDLYSAPPTGTIGVVDHVDDMGQVHINWKNGSTLPLAIGIDEFEVLELQDE